jgi:hypothetical protein
LVDTLEWDGLDLIFQYRILNLISWSQWIFLDNFDSDNVVFVSDQTERQLDIRPGLRDRSTDFTS